jgi:hypothetical protein
VAALGSPRCATKVVRITLETLLKPVSNAVIVVFRFDDRDRDVRLLVEDVVEYLLLPRLTSLPRTMIRPFVKNTSSRICDISSQPARRSAGVMNFVQMSRSLISLFSIALSKGSWLQYPNNLPEQDVNLPQNDNGRFPTGSARCRKQLRCRVLKQLPRRDSNPRPGD